MSEAKDSALRPTDRVVTGPEASTPDLQSRHVTGPVLCGTCRHFERFDGRYGNCLFHEIAALEEEECDEWSQAMQVSPTDGETPPPAQ